MSKSKNDAKLEGCSSKKQNRPTGRMIRRDLSDDSGIACLSDGAARLYFHLIPHLDSHGKFTGGPGTIRETVVPLLRWSRKRILSYLVEINSHTSMKVWKQFERFCIHDIRFFEKQDIREDRRGRDTLPSYPGEAYLRIGVSKNTLPEYVPDPLPPEVEVEVEVKEKGEVSNPGEDDSNAAPAGGHEAPRARSTHDGIRPDLESTPEIEEFQALLEQRRAEQGIRPDGKGKL